MKQMEKHEQSNLRNELWLSGLIALSFIILQGFISMSTLNLAAWISVVAFATAIPLMSGALATNFEQRHKLTKPSRSVTGAALTGILSSYIGILAAFCHISGTAGILFLGSTLVAFVVHFSHRTKLRSLEEQEARRDQPMEPGT